MTKTPEISPELQIEINRQRWIQALRENGYRQCKRELFRDQKVCALGLAGEIMQNNNVFHIRQWLGIPYTDRNHPCEHTPHADNDAGKTFAQIADAAQAGRYWSV